MIRFALLGCGRISKKHIDAIKKIHFKNGTCELVAVCDQQSERAEAVGRANGVPYFSSLKSMFADMGSKIDVVNILTPSGHHANHTIEVAKAGKHVVVEKPMALSLEDADRMIHACDEAGVRLFVVKQNRFNVAVQKLKQTLDEGRFGKLVMGTVRVRWCRDQKYYDQDAWRGTWALDGGVFANQASHHIDLLQWMLGDIDSAYAVSRTALVKIETEDTAAAILKFSNGSIGIVEATTATRPRDLEGSLSILGEKGAVEIGGFAVNQIIHWQFSDETEDDKKVVQEFRELPDNVYGFGHVAYLENVIQTIEKRGAALVDGLSGRKSLELINALYESIETGQEVAMRFKPRKSRLGIA